MQVFSRRWHEQFSIHRVCSPQNPSGHLKLTSLHLYPLYVSSRFGKKKDDKSKDAAKASRSKLEALSEEELDRIPDSRDGYDSRCGRNASLCWFWCVKSVKREGFYNTEKR